MENNLENKGRFFAQYYGQDVLTVGNAICDNTEEYWIEKSLQHTQYLFLKPLSLISDEDAIECLKLFGLTNFKDLNENNNKQDLFAIFSGDDMDIVTPNEYHPTIYLQLYDYLRSKSYALPYMELSVEQQIEYGWVKLTDTV